MTIHVAAAAIVDRAGRVLISRRADHLHQGGLWEFPGGKLEPGESAGDALARELQEELGLRPLAFEPLIRIRHRYSDREVLLDFFRVTRYEGDAQGLEGQPLRWLKPEEMEADAFPAADRPVISALRLPDLYLITGESPADQSRFIDRLRQALQSGLRMVQLRAHALDDAAYARLLQPALGICRSFGADLLINRPQGCVAWMGLADGIHLTARQLMALDARPQGSGLIGAACHSRAELERAAVLQLDYALLSPVLPTASHPGAAALGWRTFGEWVESANLPVYALGGMQSDLLDQARQAGGQGIAGIGAFWPD
jgi:8-oxo-dGTP diphosphatase